MNWKNYIAPVGGLLILIAIWQCAYMLELFPKIIFPSVFQIGDALVSGFINDNLGSSVLYTMSLIAKGMAVGIGLAVIFSALTIVSKPFQQFYTMVIAFCDPLPGMAMLPLAILWFGTGEATIIFIIVHSVIWPFSRNIIDGFSAIPPTYVEIGKNIGLKNFRLVWGVYLPSTIPYILTGIKTGWARAWRAIISAEMVFGVSGAVGGVGWYIFTARYKLDTPGVFASLVVIIIIGLIIEYLVFENIEKNTIRKWGVIR